MPTPHVEYAARARAPRNRPAWTPTLTTLAALLLALGVAGCGSDTRPLGDASGTTTGAIDPAGGSVLLSSTSVPGPDGVPVRIELVGRNLRTEPADDASTGVGGVFVLVDVAVRNAGDAPLYAPAEILIQRLPTGVTFEGADQVFCPRPAPGDKNGCIFVMSYATRLGEDAALTPAEVSGERTWRFRMVHAVPFSFGIQARFGNAPERSHIAGVAFFDPNENGHRDPGEGAAGGVTVHVSGPGVPGTDVPVGDTGAWSIAVEDAGLYTLTAQAPPSFAAVHFTTPNPLQVVLTERSDGGLDSFDGADFGLANDALGAAEPVILLDGDPGQLPRAPYSLVSGGLDAAGLLSFVVGYSGCDNDHPFHLYMVGGFMESNPVRARLVLSHDDRGELCDAAFSQVLRFNPGPILATYSHAYGQSGVVVLLLTTPDGLTHTFTLGDPAGGATH